MKAAIVVWVLVVSAVVQDNYGKQRGKMVSDQIEERGISNSAVLAALRKTPRHLFVPESQVSSAYEDRPLPIGHGQTISQPYIVAYMTDVIKPSKNHRVLEVGTGSGYQAAILGEIVSEVYTIEIIRDLGAAAEKRLQKLNYENVHVKVADGFYGWKEHAPFDAIVVTAAAEHIPPPLLEQLKEGGRMIIPVGTPFMVQQLMLVEKTKGGKVKSTSLMPVKFVPFTRE